MADERLNNSSVDLTPKRSFLAPLEDEIRERAKEDPFARLLLEGWKQVFVVILAAVAVLYLRQLYISTQSASAKHSADRFAQVRQDYEELQQASNVPSASDQDAAKKEEELKKQAEKKKETEDRLAEALKAQDEVKEPYNTFFPLYSQLLSQTKGSDGAPIVRNVAELTPETESAKRLSEELSLLAYARQKLADPAAATSARKILRELASSGVFAEVGAAVTLARAASTPEEQQEAVSVLQSLKEKYPEQSKFLDPELNRLAPGA